MMKKILKTLLLLSVMVNSLAAREILILDLHKAEMSLSSLPGFIEVTGIPDSKSRILIDTRKITSISVDGTQRGNIVLHFDGARYKQIIIPRQLMPEEQELTIISTALHTAYPTNRTANR